MKTRAAVLRQVGLPHPYSQSKPLAIEEVELAPPCRDEVLVRIRAAGLCHSDLSVINGDRPRPVPMAIGHEAAGEVMALGEGVTDLSIGDHVALVFVPPKRFTRAPRDLARGGACGLALARAVAAATRPSPAAHASRRKSPAESRRARPRPITS
jgi:NADPH:quinone reductase-like Zn-dependent oxidoreductase